MSKISFNTIIRIPDFIKNEYYDEFKNEITYEEFLECFIKEEELESEFYFHNENGTVTSKTVREWLDESTDIPSYFAHQDY